MNKARPIVGWILLIAVAGAMLLASSGKVMGNPPEDIKKGLEESKLDDDILLIGIGEMVSAILLLIPRTWSVGLLLTSSFWGGAIVAHMTKDDSFLLPAAFLAVTWVGSALRNPELFRDLVGTKPPTSPGE